MTHGLLPQAGGGTAGRDRRAAAASLAHPDHRQLVAPGDAGAAPRVADATARARMAKLGMALARRPGLTGLLVYTALAILLYLPAWLAPTARWVGGDGDAQAGIWFLGWTPHAVAHGLNPLVTDRLNAPDGVNLMWNPTMSVPGMVVWPVTALFGPVASFNVLATVATALSAWCAYMALRRYVSRAPAAFWGGLLYGFSAFMLGQNLGHLNIALAFVPPLVLLVLDEVVARRRRSPVILGLALGLLAVAQLFIFEEILASMALVALVVLVVLAVHHRDAVGAALPRLATATAVAIGVFAVLGAPALAVEFLGPQAIHGHVQPHNMFVTDLLGFVVPTPLQLVAPAPLADLAARFSGNIGEWNAYLGVPLIAIAIYAARRFRTDPTVRVFAWSAAALAVLSLGPNLHVLGRDTGFPLPWRAVQSLPLLAEMLPSRLAEYVALCVAVLAAVFVDRVLLGPRSTTLARAGAVAAVACLLPALPYPTTAAQVPAFFRGDVSRIPDGDVALVLPYAQDWTSSQAMLWQAVAGYRFRMPEGYFVGPKPGGDAMAGPPATPASTALRALAVTGTRPAETTAARARYEADLTRWGVHTIILGPGRHQVETRSFVTWLVGRPPVEDGGVEVWWDVQPPATAAG